MFGIKSINRILNIAGKAAEFQMTKVLMESASDLKDYQAEKKLTKEDLIAANEVTKLMNDELF